MTHVITQPCCNDASCVPVCPVDCIHPTPDEPGYATAEMLYIDPETCIDCGACLDVCPVEAIVSDDDLEGDDDPYLLLNAAWYEGRRPVPVAGTGRTTVAPPAGGGPLRVAVVGSGPAACYAVESLFARRELDIRVSMLERLPVPGGLLRYGVAPDHPGTRGAGASLSRSWNRPGFTLHLNVEIGSDLSHADLLEHHHAVVYAVGAPGDRRLDVPGEDLRGSLSAREFVAWYNGHPEAAALEVDLSTERAVVIGNGNVALDVARVLVTDPDRLHGTDIAEHALTALADSAVREVMVVGRRGAEQAAFATPELLELAELPGVDLVIDPAEVAPAGPVDDPIVRWKANLLRELAERPATGAGRRIVLRFRAAPEAVLGEAAVTGVRLAHNDLVDDGGRTVARPNGRTEDVSAGLVLRAVGYRGTAVPGLPFDEDRGVLPHRDGRVVDPTTGAAVAGTYAAGWIKRGPSGVIGTNRWCAESTVETLLADYAAGRLEVPAHGDDGFADLLADRCPNVVGLDGWKAIDAHERESGRSAGRPRRKLVDVRDMLDVAVGARTT